MAKKTAKELLANVIEKNLPAHYVRQPIEFTLLKADLNLTKVNLLVELVEAVQDKIRFALEKGKDEKGNYANLFSRSDLSDGYVNIDIKLSAFNISTSHYSEIEEAALALQDVRFTKVVKDEKGNERLRSVVLFPSVEVPKDLHDGYATYDDDGNRKEQTGKRYKGYIRFGMVLEEANALFNLRQHTQFLKAITSTSKSQYTSRIYMCISTHKNTGKWFVTYNDLRRLLGVTKYYTKEGARWKDETNATVTFNEEDVEEKTIDGAWVRVKYPGYGQFKQKVLSKAEKDLNAMRDEGVTDCYFTLEEVLPRGLKRGTPERFVFHIHKTDMARMLEANNSASECADMKKKFVLELGMKSSDADKLSDLINDDNRCAVNDAIESVMNMVEKRKAANNEIKNVGLYAYRSIYNAIMDAVPKVEEVVEETATATEQPLSPTLSVSHEDAELFNQTLSCIDADWQSAFTFLGRKDGKAVVELPTRATMETYIHMFGSDWKEKMQSALGDVEFVFKNTF